jgi:hypothetical protein
MSPRSSESPPSPGIFDALLFVSVIAVIIGLVCVYLELNQYGSKLAGG